MADSKPLALTNPVPRPMRGGQGPCLFWHFGLEPPSPELVLVNFACTRAARRVEYAPHRSELHELILVRRGSYEVSVDGKAVPLRAPAALLVGPGEEHRDAYAPGTFAYGIQFAWQPLGRRNWLGENLIADASKARRVPLPADFPWDALERWSPHAKRIEAFHELRMHLGLLEILYASLLHFPRGALALTSDHGSLRDDAFRERLDAMFAQSLARAPSVGEMAAAMGMKPDAFARECTRLLGISPRRAQLRSRLARARARLLAGEGPLKDLAEELGFASPFHFSRVFRTQFGYPPSRLLRAKAG